MKSWVHKIIQYFCGKRNLAGVPKRLESVKVIKAIKEAKVVKAIKEAKVRKVIKEEIMINKDFLKTNHGKITHCIMHHSTTKDGLLTNDWEAIDVYHRSFRINWNIIVRPITDLVILADIKKNGDRDYVKINCSWYLKDKVKTFYKQASVLIGEELYIGQYVSKYVKNTKIETPWRAIGYNLGIERDCGRIQIKYGRCLVGKGAHCYQEGMNEHSIGLLIVGNYDIGYPDSDLWKFCIKAAKEIKSVFPKIKFLGHREVKGVKKSCPGELWDMKQFRKDLKNKVK